MSDEGLRFEPLCWTYHDGWRWNETKLVQDGANADGTPIWKDRSKHFHHRGHCHLFFAGLDVTPQSSKQAYWGSQEYEFHIVDEWGPNSDNPGQTRSVRLIGKPIWYFHIEEYWRRMYIQPWDRVDKTCRLPLNQTNVYEQMTLVEYLRGVVEENGNPSSEPGINIDDIEEDDTRMSFDDYWLALRRVAARRTWASLRDFDGLDPQESSDSEILSYIRLHGLFGDFEEFFLNETGAYGGFVTEEEALKKYVAMRHYETADYKTDQNGFVRVPRKEKEGHVGIKWDASKPCHSLGPFREGGSLYFFNTAVNRAMPCEYWLDEEGRTRQYFIKRSEPGVETSGGQTWTFADDRSRWIWVEDVFGEAEAVDSGYAAVRRIREDQIENYYVVTWRDGLPYINEWDDNFSAASIAVEYTNHRIRNLGGSSGYVWSGCNAKRIRDGKEEWYGGGLDGAPGWRGSNDRIRRSPYDEEAFADRMRQFQGLPRPNPYYDEDGYHDGEAATGSAWVESASAVHWEIGRWHGWYEADEVVRSAFDGNWYRRSWRPAGYDKGALGEEQGSSQPYWTREKRRHFPNPPPWLCDGNGEDSTVPPTLHYDEENHPSYPFARDPAYYFRLVNGEKEYLHEANRIHLMHWEYAHYYNLVRPYEGGSPSSTPRRRYTYYIPREDPETGNSYMEVVRVEGDEPPENTDEYQYDQYESEVIALDWETAVHDWIAERGQFPRNGIDDENECFDSWIASVWTEFISCYDDKIAQDADGNPVREVFYAQEMPIPRPGEGFVPSESLTVVSFREFCQVWSRLTVAEIRRLGLHGDMPVRKLDESDSSKFLPYDLKDRDTDEEKGIGMGVYPVVDESGERLQDAELVAFREGAYLSLESSRRGTAMPSLLMSAFFPRIDEATRRYNEEAARSIPPRNGFPLSPQDEGAQLDAILGAVASDPSSGIIPRRWIDIIDPCRNGAVNPIENWKKYFDKREEYTIPDTTVARGDRAIYNTGANTPFVHPRETSYSEEDGARRHYPDDKYVTPIIEYQRVVHLDYGRLPGHDEEEIELWNDDPNGPGKSWKTDAEGQWGDGFDVKVSIPYSVNGEVQSPFSDAGRNVLAPNGEAGYCHGVVKPENMMRYRIETYSSLDQIRKYDFINYIDLIHEFQMRFVDGDSQEALDAREDALDELSGQEGFDRGAFESSEAFCGDAWKLSPYQEDFNDYDGIDDVRSATYEFGGRTMTWKEWLDEYWEELQRDHDFVNVPVLREKDCYGADRPRNRFVRLRTTGKMLWAEDDCGFLPTEEQVAYVYSPAVFDGFGRPVEGEQTEARRIPGYYDSNGNLVRGGAVVRWNNPFPENADGVWVEQCLGAVVRPKCCLVLEDSLGYRWKQWVEDTAMQSNDPLRGNDYDLGG